MDVTLTAASRANLLALQNTQTMVDRTNNRLATGQAVASPVDDAVKYFQAKSLQDRADDLVQRKDKIDQGVSALKVTINATSQATQLIKNMKGILDSSRSASQVQRASSTKQLQQLMYQVEKLIRDASYQGLNLLASSSSTLTVYFSDKNDAKLKVDGTTLVASSLYRGSQLSVKLGINISVGGLQGSQYTLIEVSKLGFSKLSGYTISQASVQNKLNSVINLAINRLDNTVANIQAQASNFGTSLSILQTRLDFTKDFVNSLKEGAGKLTLADTNEEGANLLALQTRQQLGVKTLSFAGQSEQAVLQLFR
jgi:flagellin-like hook-associated protein FlgL